MGNPGGPCSAEVGIPGDSRKPWGVKPEKESVLLCRILVLLVQCAVGQGFLPIHTHNSFHSCKQISESLIITNG